MGSKYRAVRTEVDGQWFHSKKEATDYLNFRALERSGAIAKLELQVPFVLWAWSKDGPVEVAKYVADFKVTNKDGTIGIFDSKGFVTPIFKLKSKMFHACYPHLRIVTI